jgi:uncharacterized hydantoinase/oxoprolinase family protein
VVVLVVVVEVVVVVVVVGGILTPSEFEKTESACSNWSPTASVIVPP